MKFGEYFEKYLLNESSIQEKIKLIEEKNEICINIIDNYNYIEWLVLQLTYNDNDIMNNSYLEYFYFAIKNFLEKKGYYEFYDYNYFVIEYKGYYIEFNYDNNLICNLIDKTENYISFENIVNKKESDNKDKYDKYFDQLYEIKKVLPKKLIKERLDL